MAGRLWLHEYRIQDHALAFARHEVEDEMFLGRVKFYLAREDRSDEWLTFLGERVREMAKRVNRSIAAQLDEIEQIPCLQF